MKTYKLVQFSAPDNREHDQLSFILLLKPDIVKLLSWAAWAGVELIFFLVAGMGIVLDSNWDSVDNTGMFSLLLGCAYTQSKPFLLHTPPHQGGVLLWFSRLHIFCFTHLTVFIATHRISHFYSSDSFPHPFEEREWLCGADASWG